MTHSRPLRSLTEHEKTRIAALEALFLTGAIGGWLFETLFYRLDQGVFVRLGHGHGPWLPIYGFGVLLIILLTERVRDKPCLVFLISGGSASLLEYLTGWYLYTFHNGLRLWNYESAFWSLGNLNGFTCLFSAMGFAVGGLLVIYIVEPFITEQTRRTSPGTQILLSLLTILFAADFIQGYLIPGAL